MQITSYYQAVCVCGKANPVKHDKTAFICECGIKSVVDFRAQLSKGELVKLIDDHVKKADHLAALLEIRRERVTS